MLSSFNYTNQEIESKNTMKDLSLFLLKNVLGLKMKKGFKNFCSGDGSTSTLDQQKSTSMVNPDLSHHDSPFVDSSTHHHHHHHQPPTLEEMIMQLDLEEKMARRAKVEEYGDIHHRMSCVNSSDILRSARNALNQYPRFSLDGKDSMYRSSFRNFDPEIGNRKSVDRDRRIVKERTKLKLPDFPPAKVAGERVIWCKPGVVGKLMGLDAIPIPIKIKERVNYSDLRKQNLRRRCEREGIERRKMNENGGSCSRAACLMKPVAVEIAPDEMGWPMRRLL